MQASSMPDGFSMLNCFIADVLAPVVVVNADPCGWSTPVALGDFQSFLQGINILRTLFDMALVIQILLNDLLLKQAFNRVETGQSKGNTDP